MVFPYFLNIVVSNSVIHLWIIYVMYFKGLTIANCAFALLFRLTIRSSNLFNINILFMKHYFYIWRFISHLYFPRNLNHPANWCKSGVLKTFSMASLKTIIKPSPTTRLSASSSGKHLISCLDYQLLLNSFVLSMFLRIVRVLHWEASNKNSTVRVECGVTSKHCSFCLSEKARMLV